ncbi:DRMBL-domain-containing protein [Gigaspora margarita]|uniref:DRMBL-domain-containing protein n=1 Tax=Gigaspora margarita TaxID=4874 RepID=A0A8H4AGU8_GIGMA|nr:DRMBL-domain-containing protein [Gigaspora margarita]
MTEDSDKDIWNAKTIERLREFAAKKSNSTERYNITSTPVKRESPSRANKNIGKKYKASSLPASPNKTNVLQRRILGQSKINTSNSTSSNGGTPTKDRKGFNSNSAKKNNTVSSTTLFDFFGRSKESNGSPIIQKGTLQEKLENEAANLTISSKYWGSSDTTTTVKLEITDLNALCENEKSIDNVNEKNIDNENEKNIDNENEKNIDGDILRKDEIPYKDESIHISVGPKSKKECPWYKKLHDTNITVDAFKYGNIPNCTAYFLSHFHSDHYVGLSSKWSHGPIYCSAVTGNLVVQQLRVKPYYVRKLPMNEEVAIDKTNATVTLIDANHCPGSALFLFKIKCANGEIKRYLHTGDFRACPRQVLHSAIAQPNNPPIDILYLDTTYLNERYCFPAQEQVVNAIIQLIKEVIKNGGLLPMKHTKTIKEQEEKVFWGIAKALNSKIYVTDAKRKLLMCQENPELEARLTNNPHEASVHVMCLTKIKAEGLIYYLQNLQPTFKHVMAFRPTGWAYKPSTCGTFSSWSTIDEILNNAPSFTMDLINPSYNSPTCQIFGVPYSEHSSFRELAAFVMSLNINRIIPTVNIESEESRKEMDYWLNRWQGEKKKKKNIQVAPYSLVEHW